MLIATQRVVGPSGATGVNVFVYESGHHALHPNASAVGQLQQAVWQVREAHATVLSYLDIDLPSLKELELLDMALMATNVVGSMPVRWRLGPLALEFWILPELRRDAAAEIHRLQTELRVALIMRGAAYELPAAPPPQPLIILEKRDAVGRQFWLEENSRDRVRTVMPDVTLPQSLGVPNATWDAFLATHPSPYPAILSALTHLVPEQANAVFGGFTVVDTDSNELYWPS